MSTLIFEVYNALKAAGVSDDKAAAAAKAIRGDLVTREYLESHLKVTERAIKYDLIKWFAAMLVAQAWLIVLIIKFM